MKMTWILTGLLTLAATAAEDTLSSYAIELESSATRVVNYAAMGGTGKIGFRGTVLAPGASGKAKVVSASGVMSIEVKLIGLEPASKFGPEYLTYVLWAISPEGRPSNLGELVLNGTKASLMVTTRMPAFALVVSAEPHFAISQVGSAVVLENVVREKDRKYVTEVTFQHLPSGHYNVAMDLADPDRVASENKVPREVDQSRNAIRIAKAAGAERFAPEAFRKAVTAQAEIDTLLSGGKFDRKRIAALARQAVQTAEEARQIAIRTQAEAKAEDEKAAAVSGSRSGRSESRSELVQVASRTLARRLPVCYGLGVHRLTGD